MFGLGYQEMMAFGVIALMLFGSKLPEVARNFGASYRELRKHLDSFQREFQNWEHSEPASKKPAFTPETERTEPTAPKFIPPPPADDNE
jgi:sec-independent protein translocase protein TatA